MLSQNVLRPGIVYTDCVCACDCVRKVFRITLISLCRLCDHDVHLFSKKGN
jgi:hypothetical protein